jgi:tetratricopeptide (TPR) repeat protein
MTLGQKFLILLAVILAVVLYFAPTHPSGKKPETNLHEDILSLLYNWKQKASDKENILFSQLEEKIQLARKSDNEAAWTSAGDELLKSARFMQGEIKTALYKEAISSYEKALAFNPNNLSTKTNLGTAIVEGSSFLGIQPMQGITLLREVVQQDSNNLEATLQLGLFSLTSQQFEKAIARFEKVMRIDSSRIDMLVYIGDAYSKMGKKNEAIKSFESYRQKINDTLISKNIEDYIKKIKQQP